MTKYSLAQLTAIRASPPQLIQIAAAAGYDFVGLRLLEVTGGDAWPLVSDRQLLRATREAMSSTGVGILDVELARLTPEFEPTALRPMLDVAGELGVRHMLTQAHDNNWARLVHNFGALCDLLSSYDITADVEFLTWTDLRGVTEANRLLQAANRTNVGITIDTLHFYRSGCRLEDLRDLPSRLFHFVQISDAPAAAPANIEGLIYAAREDRLEPGAGELDLAGILNALPANVTIAIEIPNTRMAAMMSDVERAKHALESTKRLVEQVNVGRSTAAS